MGKIEKAHLEAMKALQRAKENPDISEDAIEDIKQAHREFMEKQDWIAKWAQNTQDSEFIPIGTRFVFCRLIDRRKLPADEQGESVFEDSSWNNCDEQAYTNFAIEVVTNYLTQD